LRRLHTFRRRKKNILRKIKQTTRKM